MSWWQPHGSAWDGDGPQGTEESHSRSGHGDRNCWQDRSSSSNGNGWQDASSSTGNGWQDASSSTGNSWHGGHQTWLCSGLGKGVGPGPGLAELGQPWYRWTKEIEHAWMLGHGKGASLGYGLALGQFNAQAQLKPGGVGQAKVEDMAWSSTKQPKTKKHTHSRHRGRHTCQGGHGHIPTV